MGPQLLTAGAFDPPSSGNLEELLARHLRIGRQRLLTLPCAICGHPQAQMHHLRSVKSASANLRKGSYNYYLEIMRLANRKVAPLCADHHRQVHRGVYSGPALRSFGRTMAELGNHFPAAELERILAAAETGDRPAPQPEAVPARPTAAAPRRRNPRSRSRRARTSGGGRGGAVGPAGGRAPRGSAEKAADPATPRSPGGRLKRPAGGGGPRSG